MMPIYCYAMIEPFHDNSYLFSTYNWSDSSHFTPNQVFEVFSVLYCVTLHSLKYAHRKKFGIFRILFVLFVQNNSIRKTIGCPTKACQPVSLQIEFWHFWLDVRRFLVLDVCQHCFYSYSFMCLTNNYGYKTCLASLRPSASTFEYLLSSASFTCPDNLPIPCPDLSCNHPKTTPSKTTGSATLFYCLSALEPPWLGPRPAHHRRPRPPPGRPPAHAGPRRRLPL